MPPRRPSNRIPHPPDHPATPQCHPPERQARARVRFRTRPGESPGRPKPSSAATARRTPRAKAPFPADQPAHRPPTGRLLVGRSRAVGRLPAGRRPAGRSAGPRPAGRWQAVGQPRAGPPRRVRARVRRKGPFLGTGGCPRVNGVFFMFFSCFGATTAGATIPGLPRNNESQPPQKLDFSL